MKKIIKKIFIKIFNSFGLEADFAIKRKYTSYEFIDKNSLEPIFYQDELVKLYEEALISSEMSYTDNFYKRSRHYTLQQLLSHVLRSGLTGDVAECGCWKGHSSFIICSLLKKNNFSNNYYIFDSFEGGLSEKIDKDSNTRKKLSKRQIHNEKNCFSSTELGVRNLLKDFDFYKIYKGWIPEKFYNVENCEFIFIHIDVDLYQPTTESLNFFYDRLKKGGVIVIDDYGYTQFPGCKTAVDEFLETKQVSFFLSNLTGGCFIIK